MDSMHYMTDLIDRYFEGTSTDEAVQEIRTYFRKGDIAEVHKPYADFFQSLDVAATTEVSADFDDAFWAKALNTPEVEIPNTKLRQLRGRWWIAACFVLLAGIGAWWMQHKAVEAVTPAYADNTVWEKYEIEDPEVAAKEVEEAMRLLAKAFNKSSKKAGKEVQKMEKGFNH